MENQDKKFNYLFPVSFLISGTLILGAIVYSAGLKATNEKPSGANNSNSANVLVSSGSDTLPVKWGNLGRQMVETGVIDANQFEMLYSQRGGLKEEEKALLYNETNGDLVISSDNNGVILNMLWALGLGNKNPILENGPMADPRYGGAGNFASTGGWTLAQGNVMDHYSKHKFIELTPEQQKLVEEVAKNIYRPCCGNSTYFPDCNHGMAMLGLLELMASQGVSEGEMYKAALIVNSYWFPDNYSAISQYLKIKNISGNQISAKDILGKDFSSAAGYQKILSQIQPPAKQGGGSCGV